jgi:hypothetical protein
MDRTINFISQKIANQNSEMMNLYFKLNKRLDNFVDYIGVSLGMDNFSAELHSRYAHLAPIIADNFSDYNAAYNYRSYYATIEGETEEYPNFLTGVTDILDLLRDIDVALSNALDLGRTEQNDDYIKFINDEELNLRKFKKQFVFIYDKVSVALKQGNNLIMIDHFYKDYIIE